MFEHFVFDWRDLLDIALVSALLYQVIQLLRGSRALAVLTGLGLLTLLYFMSRTMGLYTLTWLLQHIFSSRFIHIVVIFQADIRQALGEMGAHRLFRRRELKQGGVDASGRPYGIGRIGNTVGAPMYAPAFAAFVKQQLGANGVRYVDARRPVRRVAVGGGACADLVSDALALGCDTFVTADVKYNGFLDAKALGINLIDAGHYPTEQVVVPVLAKWLSDAFPKVEVFATARHKEAFSYG